MRITKKAGRRAIMGVATIAVVGASITGAEARIPGVGNGVQITTDAPDLRSVKIVDNDLKRVQFCYDQAINGAPTATRFILQTYDANRYFQGGSATVDADAQNCARVQFPAGADLAQATIGTDISGGVQDAANRASTVGTEPLGGSAAVPTAGRTTAPDLVSGVPDGNAVTDGSGGSIRYVFDEAIDNALTVGTLDPNDFGFYNEAGAIVTGSTIVSRDGTSVRVGFNSPVAQGARAFALAGAVRDEPQSANVAGGPLTTDSGTDAVALTRTTNRPSIAGISGGPRQFVITYNQDVNPAAAARLQAVLDDGATITAQAVEPISGAPNTQVRVTFPVAVGDEAAAVVRIVDLAGGVTSRESTPLNSAVSVVNSGTANNTPGFTNAPDLLSISRSGTQVTFRYDEKVEDGAAAAFFTAVSGGSQNFAGGSVVEKDNTVTVDAGNAANNSVGAGNVFGSVQDSAGHLSPYSLIGYNTEQAPPTTPTPTTPTTTTPPGGGGGTTPPTVKRSTFRTSFTSFKVKSRTRYSGRIASSGRGCKSGRRIALKRSGKTIRNGFTKGDGTFTIARTAGLRGKKGVYVVVTERTTSTTVCTARSSKKLKRG